MNIDGIGSVQPNGSQTVSPASSTTYHLTAQGPAARPKPPPASPSSAPSAPPAEAPQAEAPSPTEAELFQQYVKDIYFDYDSYDLRADDQPIITADAAFLAAHPSIKFTIEGHCDERGSTEYNLALGDNRANSAREALVKAGVTADQIKIISYGKEKPFCTEHTRSAGSRTVAITSCTDSSPGIACAWAGRLRAPRHGSTLAESARLQDNAVVVQNHCSFDFHFVFDLIFCLHARFARTGE